MEKKSNEKNNDLIEISDKLKITEISKTNEIKLENNSIFLEKMDNQGELKNEKIDKDAALHIEFLEEKIKNSNLKDTNFIINTIKNLISISTSITINNKKNKNENSIIKQNLIISNNIAISQKEKFLSLIKNRLTEKKLIFTRHAQAEHNYYNIHHKKKGIKKPEFYDPNITHEGILQCEEIKDFFKNLSFNVEIIFISPLRRTLQTYQKIRDVFIESNFKINENININTNTKMNSNTTFIVTELLREKVKNPKTHFGHSITHLKKIFNHLNELNFEYIKKEIWWTNEKDEDYNYLKDSNLNSDLDLDFESYLVSASSAFNSALTSDFYYIDKDFIKEDSKDFEIRILMQLIWFIFRDEKNGCLISHSKVFSFIYKNKKKATHGGQYILDNKIILDFIADILNRFLN
jgi:bisphosphoglycerate-dependent phosphoglycerate mutase